MRIGIDPGLSGAMVLMEEDLSISDLIDMPVMPVTAKRNQVNGAEVARIIKFWQSGHSERILAYLEQVSAMPGQGVSSMFSFGVSYGIMQGVLATLSIPVIFVTPQRWKKNAGIIGKEKDFARTVAQRLYPLAELSRKKDIGRADAILIARFSA